MWRIGVPSRPSEFHIEGGDVDGIGFEGDLEDEFSFFGHIEPEGGAAGMCRGGVPTPSPAHPETPRPLEAAVLDQLRPRIEPILP